MAQPGSSVSERRRLFEEAQRATAPSTPSVAPAVPRPQWPPPGFAPPPGGWKAPEGLDPGMGISDVWSKIWSQQSQPGGVKALTPAWQEWHNFWKGFTPEQGTPLTPDLQGVVGRKEAFLGGGGSESPGPFSFNVGPQMASVPLGEVAGPSAPWAGWQPAQEEYT